MYNILEICVDSFENGIKAVKAGADRLEVNSALPLGGLTPSCALVKLLKERIDVPIIAMIRPSHGYFTYTDYEFLQMQKEAYDLICGGADGIAFGFLNSYGRIDTNRVKKFVELADGKETVFHRAFDLLYNPLENMHLLEDLGVTRILTSGGKRTAIEGRALIKKMIAESQGKIRILPAGGIRPHNAKDFIRYTKADQLHSSCIIKTNADNVLDNDICFIDKEIDDQTLIKVDEDQVKKLAAMRN